MTSLPETIGRYRIVRRLGTGGMGSVYLAHDPAIDREVAIKLLKEGIDDPELRERFTREARSAGGLRHPTIVTIFDVGEQSGQPFIAMEYVPGETLAKLISSRTPLPLPRKLKLVEELCAGLAYAHKAGIVHRDVKPANLVVDHEGGLKILDFGIARIAESGMTQLGTTMGTLPYMSPEQYAGKRVDHRADIYAVGAVFYELLAYRRAFPGTVEDGLMVRILNEPPQPLGELCPGLDPEIEAIVTCCLEKDPNRRYADLRIIETQVARIRQRLERSAGPSDLETIRVSKRPRPPIQETPRPPELRGVDPDELARPRLPQTEEHGRELRRATSEAADRLRSEGQLAAEHHAGPLRQARDSLSPPEPGDATKLVSPPGATERPRTRSLLHSRPLQLVAALLVALGLGLSVWRPEPPVPDPPGPRTVEPSPAVSDTPEPTPPEPERSDPPGPRNVEPSPAVADTPAPPEPDRPDLDPDTAEPGILAAGTEEPRATEPVGTAAAAEPDAEDEAAQKLTDLRLQVSQLVDQGALEPAADVIGAGLDLAADDRQLLDLVGRLTRAAEARMSRAKSEAVSQRAPELVAEAFAEATQEEQRGTQARGVGRNDEAARAFLTAAGLFETATAQSRQLAAATPSDEAAVRQALGAYEAAYESLSVSAVINAAPFLARQSAELQRSFSRYQAFAVDFEDVRIAIDGDTARVTCIVTRSFQPRSGRGSTSRTNTVFFLEKSGGAWSMTGMQSR